MPLVWGCCGGAVFDAKVAAQQIELVLAGGRALAQAEQAVGERLAARHWARTNGALGQHRSDVDRAGPFEIVQKPAGIGGGLGFADAHEHPAGRPINGHEPIAP